MKKIIFLFLIISIFFQISFSQEAEIKKIRELYKTAQENIGYQRDSLIPFDNLKITLNQNMPAIGQQTFDYEFYFSLEYSEETEGEYFHQLYFATKSYNIAASYFSYEEFLFNDKGELVFYFIKYSSGYEPEFNREVRCYFQNEKLIKINVKEAPLNYDDENPIFNQIYENSNVVPDYFKEDYSYILSTAEEIKNIYNKFK